MKTIFKFSMWIAILTIAMVGCKKDNSDNPKDPKTTMQSVTLRGIVNDINGAPLGGVRVTTGTLIATTGNDGKFSFQQASVIDRRAVIKFEKDGYFTNTRSGVKEDEMYIKAVLQPKGNSNISMKATFASSSAKTLEVAAGMKVELPASSVERADGSAYSGTVNADMLYLDPNNENFASMMPGGDLAAITSNNNEVMLISWGMTNVNLTDNAGKPLQLKKGSPATLTFPIPAGMENNPPATIPLWHFDEEKGIWVESGVATLQGDVYVGQATHFSWVNLDEPAKRVTIKGKVVDCKGDPVSFVQVKADQTAGVTNSKGEYTVVVPEQTPVTLSVTANGGSDSQYVPGQPGNTTYTAQNLKVPCPEQGEAGTLVYTEKASIKYMIGHESDEGSGIAAYYIVTFDNNGKRLRWDMITDENEEGRMAEIINHINKTYWRYTFYFDPNTYDYGFRWEDVNYKDAPQNGGAPFQFSASGAELLKNPGCTKLSDKTYAGKLCNVYSYSLAQYGVPFKYTFAIWNGLTLFMEMSDGSETMFWVAQSVTLDVPDVAFTKTLDITWLK